MPVSKKFSGLILALFVFFPLFCKKKSEALYLTVFVHGSVHCHLSMLSPRAAWKDLLEEDAWYVKMLVKVRDNPLLWQSRFMLGMGPQEVPAELIERFHQRKLTNEESKLSAYHIVAAYDALARHVDTAEQDRAYYLFGHLGLLSQSYRKSVGHELYSWLVDLVEEFKSEYETIHIDVVAHSHGGNISLWLSEFESQYHKGLFVDNLIMYATPIQVETFRFAYKPAFGRVFNLYSDGDRIQGMDRLSTARGKSYKTFSNLHLPVHYETSEVYDVRLLVNNKRKRVGHANMFLMDVSNSVTRALRPAPLVVLTPVLLATFGHPCTNILDCNVVEDFQSVCVEFKDDDRVLARSENLWQLSSQLDQLLAYNWRPDYPMHLQSEPARLGRITFDAIKDLWRGGAISNNDMPQLIAKL